VKLCELCASHNAPEPSGNPSECQGITKVGHKPIYLKEKLNFLNVSSSESGRKIIGVKQK
jgi:hypothetical protein